MCKHESYWRGTHRTRDAIRKIENPVYYNKILEKGQLKTIKQSKRLRQGDQKDMWLKI